MLDTVVTAKAKATLTFEDHTTVKISEQSKLLIDDFVYDSNKGSGKLAMKVALGTARYASGQIAKSNPQSVNIQTPTATIAVRGTDFSMTVDELGRSLVMLLPSCDAKTCITGAIEVMTDAGSVFMQEAYQTTLVTSRTLPPSKPVVITIDQSNINNLLIISPPPQVTQEITKAEQKSDLDINFLNVDLLKYDELTKDQFDTADIGLNKNFLDINFLRNALDAPTALNENYLDKAMLPGYSEASGLKYSIDTEGRLVLDRTQSQTVKVIVDKNADLKLNINQSGNSMTQKVNDTGTTVININQKQ